MYLIVYVIIFCLLRFFFISTCKDVRQSEKFERENRKENYFPFVSFYFF